MDHPVAYFFIRYFSVSNFDINVHHYINERVKSNYSQFESFLVATEKLAIDMLLSNYPADAIRELVGLVNQIVNISDDSYSLNLAYAFSELFDGNEEQNRKINDALSC